MYHRHSSLPGIISRSLSSLFLMQRGQINLVIMPQSLQYKFAIFSIPSGVD